MLIYRSVHASPLSHPEISTYTGYYRSRFSAIVVPIAADGILGTREDSIIRQWSREWITKVNNFASNHDRRPSEMKGQTVRALLCRRETAYCSIELIGVPVTPSVSGVLQYSWLDKGLEEISTAIRKGASRSGNIALANFIRPDKDEGVSWDVVNDIIKKRFGGLIREVYVYPPNVHGISVEALQEEANEYEGHEGVAG